jgi:parvulin-like peptidyl-prolyl isomerase
MKKLITALSITATMSFAGLVNGVAITVDNEPITLYEIEKVRDRFKVNPSQAAELLVREIIMKRAIENNYPEYDIEEEISSEVRARADRLNMTPIELKDKLLANGFSWQEYREDVQKELVKIKFLNLIREKRLVQIPKENELLSYYKTNMEKFSSAKEVEVVEYTSESQKALEYIKNTPMATLDAVKSVRKKYNLEEVPALAGLINETSEGAFTPNMKVSRDSAQFVSLYVVKKIGTQTISYENAKDRIMQMLIEKKSKNTMNDYIQKLKTDSDIKVIR